MKAENLKRHLCRQMANHEVPDISEYLEARIKCKKLQQDIHTWERKVRIAQVYFTSSDPIREPQPHFFLFCPTSAGNVVTKHLAALLCLVQMTSRTGAKAAGAAACSAERGARPAGCHVPVKLPLLPEHR